MAIGTVAAIAMGASAIGGIAQAGAAKSAAKAQTNAANQQMAVQKEMYDQTRGDLAPYRESGLLGQQAAQSMLGLGAAPMIGGTRPTITEVPGIAAPATQSEPTGYSEEGNPIYGNGFPGGIFGGLNSLLGGARATPSRYQVGDQYFDTREAAEAYAGANMTGGTPWSFETSPSYQFNFDEGMNALNASAATRGGLMSGATLKAAQKFGSGLASNEYWQTYNALAGMGTVGQNAAAQTGAASQNYAQGASNALANMGNAQAAGAIGVGNAINSGIGNALGTYGYMNGLGNKSLTGNQFASGVY